jgi:hypothetical protein
MLTLVRCDLHDEESERYRFSDDALTRHILRAVKDFSEAIPVEQTATAETTPGSHDVDISEITGRVIVEAAEYPAGKFPKCYQRFSIWGDTLTLLGEAIPDGSNAIIYYGGLHILEEESSTIPEMYEDLIAAGAAGYSAMEVRCFHNQPGERRRGGQRTGFFELRQGKSVGFSSGA